jgi:peptide/nickel transport system ATP-binding protein
MSSLLTVEDLRVEIPTARGVVVPVQGVSFEIAAGSMLGLVGESGSGKSMTAMSLLNMLPDRQARVEGRITLDGDELTSMSSARLRRIRGGRVGTIFQEPLTALNPVFTVRDQLVEPLRVHKGLRKRAAHARGVELLDMVGIKEPARVMDSYPFQLSGGMRQRVMIAIAMACEPRMLIADEPTTALDVTTQAQILDLIVGLQRDHGTAVLLITHDLGLVAQTCDRVAVMNQGRIVETAATGELFSDPQHDYTKHLMSFRPPAVTAENLRSRAPVPAPALLRVTDIAKTFPGARGKDKVHAVRGVSFEVQRGRTTAIVGESGSGKSTTGRCLLRLIEPNAGEIVFDGEDVRELGPEALRKWRSRAQIIFQDTYASLDPRWKVGDSLAEPLRVHARMSPAERREQVRRALVTVGLPPESADRFPHEFSGGQRQRIGIARALVTEPELVVCDEPVSALDVSVQAQVLELLRELQERLDLTYVFITHDLSVVAEIADDVVVMNQGEIVEQGPVSTVLIEPDHPYTRALLAAIPPSDPNEKWNLHEQVDLVDAGLRAVS